MNTKEYLLSAWDWNPYVIGVSVVACLVYMKRVRLTAHAFYFFAGVAVFFLTLASPLNALAAGFLFSAHMMQHMLLLLIVPILLLLGLPAWDANVSHAMKRFRLPPLLGWAGGVGAMWAWHERTLCELATRTETVRVLQIVTLLALGALFWWPLAGPEKRRHISPLAGVVYLFSACIGCSVLGIFIAFAPLGGVCPIFLHPPDHPAILNMIRNDWGFSPAKDQQVGGLLMWVPGCGIYLAGVMAVLARWYRAPETREFAAAQPSGTVAPGFVRAQIHGGKQ